MRKVLYSANVGQFDKLRPAPRLEGWATVMFVDRPPNPVLRLAGGLGWEFRVLDPALVAEGGPIFASRAPKLTPHLFLPEFDYSLYIDANIILHADPATLLERRGWPTFLTSQHPYRQTLAEELRACIDQGKGPADILTTQVNSYWKAGLPPEAPLFENNVLARLHHDPACMSVARVWWAAFKDFPYRDQLSLPWALHSTGFSPAVLSQAEKKTVFQAKKHDRSVLKRLRKSVSKRLGLVD